MKFQYGKNMFYFQSTRYDDTITNYKENSNQPHTCIVVVFRAVAVRNVR